MTHTESRRAAPGDGVPGGLEDRLRAVLDHAADAILVIDTGGRIENANLAAEQLTGWSEADLLGSPIAELMPPALGAEHQARIDRYLRDGVSGILNVGPRVLPLLTRTGATIPIELSVGEAWIGGERKFVGVCRDIRQRLAQEEALRRLAAEAEAARAAAESASQAKSRFMATMSHELRTPLNGILAVADALAGRALAGRALERADLELVEIIRSSGRGLLSILNELLDLARIEAGALTLEPTVFAPAELVRTVARVWKVSADAKGLDLRLAIEDLPVQVRGDAGRLRQVLSNLLNNAIKFTERGGVTLAVRPGRPGRLVFAVSDSGPGIAPADRERFFQPFIQAESGADRRHGGAGLGLAICRELTALMGGTIAVEAGASGGACFVVDLPLPAAEAAAPPAAAPLRAAPVAGAAPLILVAEDHPLNRRVAAIILESAGLSFEFAEDGRAAVAAAASGRFGLILMDVQMPGMDGLEAARAIRRLPPPAGALPIIAVTANASSEDLAACRAAGMDDMVAKPIDTAELLAAIARALADR